MSQTGAYSLLFNCFEGGNYVDKAGIEQQQSENAT